jgi:hypothetical protein
MSLFRPQRPLRYIHVGVARHPTVETMAQLAIAGRHGGGHQPMPLLRRRRVPARPHRRCIRAEAALYQRSASSIDPGTDAVAWLHQIGMWVEARIQQRNRDPPTGLARVGVHAQRRRQRAKCPSASSGRICWMRSCSAAWARTSHHVRSSERHTRSSSATPQACATAPRGRCGGSPSRISETEPKQASRRWCSIGRRSASAASLSAYTR